MEIRELNLKHFGKFSNQTISFQSGINLISGVNESGKTTIHQFIRAMLFGMERGRGRAARKDVYRTYEPWENPGIYDGGMRIVCDGKCFCLNRNFSTAGKAAELYCEDDGEGLSVEQGDLDMLLGNMSPAQFDNTAAVRQCGAETDEQLAAQLKNYAANCYESGMGELDLAAALASLREQEKETARLQKEEMLKKEQKRTGIEREISYAGREILRLQEEIEALDRQMEEQKREKERLDQAEQKRREARGASAFADRRIHPLEILGLVSAAVLSILLFDSPWNYLALIAAALAGGMYVWNCLKDGKKERQEERSLEEDRWREAATVLSKLEGKRELLETERKEKQTSRENLQEELGELDERGEQEQSLVNRRQALVLAQETLQKISGEMQKGIKDGLNSRISEILREITGGNCEKAWMDEDMQFKLVENGRRVSLFQVSRGTAEQVYFALRMAAAELLQEEAFPVILDDTFAYYDDLRLERTLRWLKSSGMQVILFTCHSREEEIMRRTGIEFHKVTL